MIKLPELVRIKLPSGETWLVEKRYMQVGDYRDEYPGVIFEYEPEATGIELAHLIDGDLESANYHSLVGLAEELYNIVKDVAGEEKADLSLEKLYDNSTLQNLG